MCAAARVAMCDAQPRAHGRLARIWARHFEPTGPKRSVAPRVSSFVLERRSHIADRSISSQVKPYVGQPQANTANTCKRNITRIPQTTATVALVVICRLLGID